MRKVIITLCLVFLFGVTAVPETKEEAEKKKAELKKEQQKRKDYMASKGHKLEHEPIPEDMKK